LTERRAVPGFDEYSVDDQGSVYSTKYGRERVLKPWVNGVGKHLALSLMRNSKRERFLVHRIVALAFMGEPPPGKHNVLHRDGNPINNALSNLYYGDQADNAADMVRHGRCFPKEHPELMPRGDSHPFRKNPSLARRGEACRHAKLTAIDVRVIRWAIEEGEPISSLGRKFDTTVQNIYRIRDRLSWRHLP
jgi:hypothetical protein